MTTIGVRELKARLSHYLRCIKKGQSIAVSERGRGIALLSPLRPHRAHAGIWHLVHQGQAAWAGGKPQGLSQRVGVKGKRLSAILIKEREDRV